MRILGFADSNFYKSCEFQDSHLQIPREFHMQNKSIHNRFAILRILDLQNLRILHILGFA